MSEIISYKEVEEKVLSLRGQDVILDKDVAELYGVETKRINEAVKNNPDKFREGYIIDLDTKEWDSLRSKISSANISSKTRALPKAFTEKGLYMLATILKSQRATETTIAIVEAFAKLREFSSVIYKLPEVDDKEQQQILMQRSGELLAEILEDNALEVSGDETTIELNLALMKIKHTVKREKRSK
jgi:phage regulator Rha-like protein